jgi:hypothetical protein
MALRDAFMLMLLPLAAGALILLAAVRPYPADAAAAGTDSGPLSDGDAPAGPVSAAAPVTLSEPMAGPAAPTPFPAGGGLASGMLDG